MTAKVACLLTGGPVYVIHVDGRPIVFEMHPYCGPVPLDARTEESRNLKPRHRFWTAVTLWAQQGRRLGELEGGRRRCIWDDGRVEEYV